MQIAYGAQARAKVLSGADRLADAVRVTLGPKGRNGAVHQKKKMLIDLTQQATISRKSPIYWTDRMLQCSQKQ